MGQKRTFTQEELIDFLRKMWEEKGHMLRGIDTKRYRGVPRSTVFIKQFGSWAAAIKQAGLDVYSQETLKAYIGFLSVYFKHPPRYHIVRRMSYTRVPPMNCFEKTFGNWTAVVARIEYKEFFSGLTQENFSARLLTMYKSLGRTPTVVDWATHYGQPIEISTIPAVFYFGSWNKALRSLGIPVTSLEMK